ncbi:MAG: NAD(P)H-hydrate epimerase [Planctomycetota bacterium]
MPDRPVHTFTRDAVRALDQAAIGELGIPSILLMENAAASIESHTTPELRTMGDDAALLVFAGPGNNGGDGLAVARRIHVAQPTRRIAIVLAALRETYTGDARTQLDIVERLGLPLIDLVGVRVDPTRPDSLRARLDDALDQQPPDTIVVLDALLGTGATSPVRDAMKPLVHLINALGISGARVLAIDVPTGLDCDTGEPLGDAIDTVRAHCTITLAGRKVGFDNPKSVEFTGEVTAAPIGVPDGLLRRFAC